MLLNVRCPEDYPDKAPILDLQPPHNASLHEYFSVADDKEQLLRDLDATIEENLGMPMVFTLVSSLKEAAEQLVAERKEIAAKVQEEELLAAEREENKKFHGTAVTPETFLRWREDFLREMEEARIQEEEERAAELKKAKVREPVKLSGKQLWEGGLVGKDIHEDDYDEVPIEKVERLAVVDS